MSDIALNDNQRRAVELDGNVVVPASAGTGKTRVLTERLVKRLVDRKTAIDRVLVVTFTEKAAAELRERITQRMTGNESLREGFEKLDLAYISTVHSFCSRMIRRHFYYLDIDPRFFITTSPFPELMEQRAAETVLKKIYAGEDAGLSEGSAARVRDLASWLDERAVTQTCLRVLDFVRSLPAPEAKLVSWLDDLRTDYAAGDVKRLKAYAWWCDEVEKGVKEFAAGMQRFVQVCLKHGAENSEKAFDGAQGIIADVAAARDVVAKATIINVSDPGPVSKKDEAAHDFIAAFRDSVRDKLRSRLGMDEAKEGRDKNYKRFEGERLVSKVFEREVSSIPYQVALVEMTRAIYGEFQHQKKRRELLDFSDLEQYAYRLLTEHADIADYYRNLFDYVLVDEFQDVNHLQDAIIRAVSRDDNLFVVGDSKQSIYGFRLTDPSIFEERARVTAAEDRERVVQLVGNYRSRADILAFVNEMLGPLFHEIGTDYPSQRLTPSEGTPKETPPQPSVEVAFIDPSDSRDAETNASDDEALANEGSEDSEDYAAASPRGDAMAAVSLPEEIEAAYLAARIAEVRNQGYRWGDIAVLVRSSGKVKAIEDALKSAGIPYAYQDTSGFYERPEVRDLLALLSIVDNPYDDVKLAAVLRSPVVGLSDDDLLGLALLREGNENLWAAAVRIIDGGATDRAAQTPDSTLTDDGHARVAAIVGLVRKWTGESRSVSMSEVVWRILSDTGYATHVLGMRHGAKRRANLLKVYQLARAFEAQEGGSLAAFTKYIQTVRALAPPEGEAQVEVTDAVNVLTVHKAKGLEFPVVFVANMGTRFNLRDVEGTDLQFHRDEGFAIRMTDPLQMQKFDTIGFKRLGGIKRRDTIAEELRILYVALTRAKERLICTSVLRPIDARRFLDAGKRGDDGGVTSVRSAAEWFARRLADSPDAGEKIRAFAESGALCDAAPVTFGSNEKVSVGFSLARGAAPKGDGVSVSPEWEKIAPFVIEREEIAVKPSIQQRVDSLISELSTPYAHKDDVRRLAKLTVTEVKEAWVEQVEHSLKVKAAQPPVDARFDEILTGVSAPGAEFGTAVHAAMQMIDLAAGRDLSLLAAELERVLTIVVSEGARASRAKRAISEFFASETGRALAENAERIDREVPFTLKLPVSAMTPALGRIFAGEEVAAEGGAIFGDDLPAKLKGSESVVAAGIVPDFSILQGKIDVLVKDPAGWWILDYKTDRVSADSIAEAVERYRVQMQIYRLAAEAIFGVPVQRCVLYFLTPGIAARV